MPRAGCRLRAESDCLGREDGEVEDYEYGEDGGGFGADGHSQIPGTR